MHPQAFAERVLGDECLELFDKETLNGERIETCLSPLHAAPELRRRP